MLASGQCIPVALFVRSILTAWLTTMKLGEGLVRNARNTVCLYPRHLERAGQP